MESGRTCFSGLAGVVQLGRLRRGMNLLRGIIAWACLGVVAAAGLAGEPAPQLIVEARDASGEFEYDLATGLATAKNGVIVRYGDAVLTAQRVIVFQDRSWVYAEGDVVLQREGQSWRCDSMTYDYKNKRLDADFFRTAQSPFFAAGELITSMQGTNGGHSAREVSITTDDYSTPAQRVRARKVTIVPGEYIEARSAVLYIGNVPVMYYPYYRRDLKRHPNNWDTVPGYRSRFGPYLLNTYNMYWSKQFDGALHLDYRQRRGFGEGADVNLHLGRYGEGEFKFYYARDERPGTDYRGNPVRDDRHRIYYSHRADFDTNFTAKLMIRRQSDAFFIRDFFEPEYRRNVQPSSYLELNRFWNNWSLDLVAQPRVNRFFETVERLPEIKLTGLRQQLGGSPFYYESDSSLGWYRRQFANSAFADYSAWRADTYHQLLYPQNYFGWLQVTPRVGGRLTEYGEADGIGTTTRREFRPVFNTGVEFSTKASKVWPAVNSRLLDMDGLRHIIEPSVNYAFVPSPRRRPPQLPQFDYELGTYRLLPLDYPDYNAIDSIDAQNVMRLSLFNKLHTKRRGQIENLLEWALYTDWRLNPRAGQQTFSDIFSDLDFLPRSWLMLSQRLRYQLGESRLNELNHSITVMPSNKWSVSVGNRYLHYDPVFAPLPGQNLFFTRFYYRINENWGFRASHHFEARDGRMEEQYYTIYRDLRSWTAALTIRFRNERQGPSDFTIAITLSLKAFPRFGMGRDSVEHSLLLGG